MDSINLPLATELDNQIPKIDFHVHTNWTDGQNSVQEMYDQACSLNLSSILFSEHARKSSEDWFLSFAEEVRTMPHSPCRAFVGVECKIVDFQGTIDISDKITSACDLIIGSVHRFPGKDGKSIPFKDMQGSEVLETEEALLLALLDSSVIDILGHPFGVSASIFGKKPSEAALRRLVYKAAEHEIAIEINSKYDPDPWLLISLCKEAGCKISIGSDAHCVEELGNAYNALQRMKL